MNEFLVAIPPAPPPPQPPMKKYRWIMYMLLAVSLFFGVRYAYDRFTHALVPPLLTQNPSYLYVYPNEDAPITTLKAGQGVFIRTYTNRIQQCTVESEYSIMQFKEVDHKTVRKVWFAYAIWKNRSLTGETITDKYLVLPDWLPPGDYVIIRQSEYDCNSQHISQDGKPLPFTVSP